MKEKQITKTIFETLDGKQFDKKDDAKQHETNLFIDSFSEKEVALILKQMCEKRHTCDSCPLHDGEGNCTFNVAPYRWDF